MSGRINMACFFGLLSLACDFLLLYSRDMLFRSPRQYGLFPLGLCVVPILSAARSYVSPGNFPIQLLFTIHRRFVTCTVSILPNGHGGNYVCTINP